MSFVRRNILSNLAGGIWTTLLTLTITPIQVRLLGIEAYGIIGFIATLQIAFAVFDLGLSSTVTRQLAADRSPNRTDSVQLLGTATTVYWTFALIVGLAVALASHLIATRWLHATPSLSVETLQKSLYAIALFLAARWPVALYSGILSGVQRMDLLNLVKASTTAVRLIGGVLVLLQWRSLGVFLWWTAASAIVEVSAFALAARRVVPTMRWQPTISLRALAPLWGFSLSMTAISLLALVISQIDRLMLSKLVPLDEFGYYMLAYNAAATLSLCISAVSSAMLPSFASVLDSSQSDVLLRRYDQATRVILFVVGLAACILVFFGDVILSLWVGASAAGHAHRSLAMLAGGFWCSAVLSNAYSVAVATGHPQLPLRVSAVSAVPYFAALYICVKSLGVDGAALAWLLLNLAYVVVLVPIIHRIILGVSTRAWITHTLLPFVILGCVTFAMPRFAASALTESSALASNTLALIASVVLYTTFGAALLGPSIRGQLRALLLGRRTVQRPS